MLIDTVLFAKSASISRGKLTYKKDCVNVFVA